jgi:hypothetical protein
MVLFLILFAGVILSNSAVVVPKEQSPNVMYPGFVLEPGQRFQTNKQYYLEVSNCRVKLNAAAYLTPKVTSVCTKEWILRFQRDGNLVLYDQEANPRWASDTGGKGYTKAWVDTKNNKFSFA